MKSSTIHFCGKMKIGKNRKIDLSNTYAPPSVLARAHGLLYNRLCQHATGGKNWRRIVFP